MSRIRTTQRLNEDKVLEEDAAAELNELPAETDDEDSSQDDAWSSESDWQR